MTTYLFSDPFYFEVDVGPENHPPQLLFTENDTNYKKMYGTENKSPYVKDAFHEFIVNGRYIFIIYNLSTVYLMYIATNTEGAIKMEIQRNWQHRVHKTKKNKTKTIQRNWQHRVHKTKKNKTKTIQRNWHHRVHNTKKNKTKTIQRNWQHRVHKTKKTKTKTIQRN